MISQERLKELLSYDPSTGIFTWKTKPSRSVKVGAVAGCKNGRGYVIIGLEQKRYRAHRLAWLCVHGEFPPEEIDHINGIRGDNRIDNLRAVNSVENSRNQRMSSLNTSGVTGVRWNKADRRWMSKIGTIHLGSYHSMAEAVSARKAAEVEHGFHENHGRAATATQ